MRRTCFIASLVCLLALSWAPAVGQSTGRPISIVPSTCQLDEVDARSEVSFHFNTATLTALNGTVTLRCNIQNPGSDLPVYHQLRVTYGDSSMVANNFVRVQVFGVNIFTGAVSNALWDLHTDADDCAQGDANVHVCADSVGHTLDFGVNAYWAVITLKRTDPRSLERIHAIQLFEL